MSISALLTFNLFTLKDSSNASLNFETSAVISFLVIKEEMTIALSNFKKSSKLQFDLDFLI